MLLNKLGGGGGVRGGGGKRGIFLCCPGSRTGSREGYLVSVLLIRENFR